MPRNADYKWKSTEDAQPAKSQKSREWDHTFTVPIMQLEVRSQDNGAGSIRLGELFLRGSVEGVLTARLEETK